MAEKKLITEYKIMGQFLSMTEIVTQNHVSQRFSLMPQNLMAFDANARKFKIEYIRDNGDVVNQELSTYHMNDDAKNAATYLSDAKLTYEKEVNNINKEEWKLAIEEIYPARILFPQMYVAYCRGEDLNQFFSVQPKRKITKKEKVEKGEAEILQKPLLESEQDQDDFIDKFRNACEKKNLVKGKTIHASILFEIGEEICSSEMPAKKKFKDRDSTYHKLRQYASITGYKKRRQGET